MQLCFASVHGPRETYFVDKPRISKHIGLYVYVHNTGNNNNNNNNNNNDSVALVLELTVPTERPPPVGEVRVNFCRSRSVVWSTRRITTAVISVL
jgi:hypothetical protein